MSFFRTLRSAELDAAAESIGEIREFVRRDTASLPRSAERDGDTLASRLGALPRPPEHDSELVATKLGSLLQRVVGASVEQIDDVIFELQAFRQRLDNESARMQREIVEYATMSQAAMQSTRIIAESLTNWKRPSDDETPSISA
ncbi:MAG TPA: hypothetical protein VFB68_03720 [Xanthobacteraceae bacterium]|jgi:hypothetical protein|nr:hypothetical protein [Xanthobacteraceae bacterium]HZO44971.1 hypothetical protein [Xanthobacteraceae bacterium]